MRDFLIGLVIVIALIGGGITVMSLEPVGQGEVGVVWTMAGWSSLT